MLRLNGARTLSGPPLRSIIHSLAEIWKMAEESGLWERGTYGSPMSKALDKLCDAEVVLDTDGNFAYHVFRLKKEA